MNINLHDYIFHQTKEGKSFRFRLEDGFIMEMDNGYRFIFDEALFPKKLTSIFDEWIHGYLSNKLAYDLTYGVGNFEFEINDGALQLNCMTELGGSLNKISHSQIAYGNLKYYFHK
tara:strand:+ start:222 stop:569 length:348 start_codon:yes stop_codon:yes gene_type:complete